MAPAEVTPVAPEEVTLVAFEAVAPADVTPVAPVEVILVASVVVTPAVATAAYPNWAFGAWGGTKKFGGGTVVSNTGTLGVTLRGEPVGVRGSECSC